MMQQPHRLAARTLAFGAGNTGSNPVGAKLFSFSFCYKEKRKNLGKRKRNILGSKRKKPDWRKK